MVNCLSSMISFYISKLQSRYACQCGEIFSNQKDYPQESQVLDAFYIPTNELLIEDSIQVIYFWIIIIDK